MLLSELLVNVKIKEKLNFSDVDVKTLEIDSRLCSENSMYFAISGTRVDGHDFAKQAVNNGSTVLIVEKALEIDAVQVVVENTRSAMSIIASNFYNNPSKKLKMIGVTGTNGKTSISYMVSYIAKKLGISCGVIGTSGINVDGEKLDIKILTSTTPDPIQLQHALAEMVKKGAKWCIMEVTAHALDLNKVHGMEFETSGFTNLTQDHLDYFVTMENYGNAKKKLFFNGLSKSAVLNLDDEFGIEVSKKAEIPTKTYSLKNMQADLLAENVKIENSFSSFTLVNEGKRYDVSINTTGLFNISNALCAIAMVNSMGIEMKKCVECLNGYTAVAGRFESVDTHDRGFSIIIDYAHTPDGLENVLNAINSFKKGKLICVFGCGGNRDAKKRSIMGEIAGRLSDFSIITSDNPRFEKPEAIIDEIESGMKKTSGRYVRNADRKEAIRIAIESAEKNDVIAICGKGDEDYQEIEGVKHHFSDRETAEKILGDL